MRRIVKIAVVAAVVGAAFVIGPKLFAWGRTAIAKEKAPRLAPNGIPTMPSAPAGGSSQSPYDGGRPDGITRQERGSDPNGWLTGQSAPADAGDGLVVANGVGLHGLGRDVASRLTGLGIPVSEVENYSPRPQLASVVLHSPTTATRAKEIATHLQVPIQQDNAVQGVVLVVGRDYQERLLAPQFAQAPATNGGQTDGR